MNNVPGYILNKPETVRWWNCQQSTGNVIEEAKLLWQYPAETDNPFAWIIWAKIWIKDEARYKQNEFVFFRPDLSCVCIYYPKENILDTEILLVSEFRSPVCNLSGKVLEIPGGSLKYETTDWAAVELYEETGLSFPLDRFVNVGSRQLLSTLTAHKAYLFAIRCNEDEWEKVKSTVGSVFGVVEDSERTKVVIKTLRELLISSDIDWSMMGMILTVIMKNEFLGNLK